MAFDWYVNLLWIFFNSRCGTCKNKISKIKEKIYPERCFGFCLSIYVEEDKVEIDLAATALEPGSSKINSRQRIGEQSLYIKDERNELLTKIQFLKNEGEIPFDEISKIKKKTLQNENKKVNIF